MARVATAGTRAQFSRLELDRRLPCHVPVPERRYSDDEVQRILASAVESDAAQSTSSSASGMTLAEIQRIAAEAGVSPASITAAAAVIDRVPATTSSARVLGLPVGVGDTVPLPRPLDDVEWQRLVAFLRDTFEAQGRAAESAGRREWRNGNLRISVDTVGNAAVLEMRTRKSNARPLINTGAAMLLGSGIMEATFQLAHSAGGTAGSVLTIALSGAAMVAMGALNLPAWSATRRRQFAEVAEYARRLTARATGPLLSE